MNTPTSFSNHSVPSDLPDPPAGDIDLTRFSHLLAHTERLATLGTLAAGVAHELNNPVSVIISTTHAIRAELQDGTLSPDRLDQFTDLLEENAWRCARLVQSLRSYSHRQKPQRADTHPQKIIENAVSLVQHQFRDRDLTLQMDIPANLPTVYWDENQIAQVMVNLILNACDATAGEVLESTITLKAGHEAEAGRVFLSVADNGSGVPEELRDRIFEPFFTTKPLGEGTGLGLSIAAGIVQQHGGTIAMSHPVEGGVCFTVGLPVESPSKNGGIP